jgi:hypothetical protein
MSDEWLRAGDAAKRYCLSRNTPRNWFKAGAVRMRGGRFSRRDIERELERKSTGRKPSNRNPAQPRLGDLSTRENELVRPFIEQHGLRKLRRLLWSLPVAASELDWTAKKRQKYANVLLDGANAISPIAIATEASATGGLGKKRAREQKRLTDASHTHISKKTGVIIFEQADPSAEPGWEILPFGIHEKDLQYVLFDAHDPAEFCKRAKERGYEIPIGRSDPEIDRCLPKVYKQYDEDGSRLPDEPGYTPDIAAEIDRKDELAKQSDTPEDILAKYKAIVDPVERECFLHFNFKAIQAARMERAEPANYEHLLNVAERSTGKRSKWIKIDDDDGFKADPAKSN